MGKITKRDEGRYCATIQINNVQRHVFGTTPKKV